ncbi:MAG TPA: hypothetical protein EYP53_01320 [Candidatus Latescibacteria bacterium]|nr:hypothetical protein [Candidatus Latescibacterota bacterium]
MKPEDVLEKVCRSIDILVNASERHEGLFPSLLDLTTHEMLPELPSAIDGQRNGDRSHQGSNLIHDQAVLKTMYALSKALDREEYARAADRYIRRFAIHCTDTVTGLFPWGEHAFWHLIEDKIGNGALLSNPSSRGGAIHDHLRQAPVWVWEKLYEYNPGCVERFAEGLDYHWKDGEPLEYSRHAHIEAETRPDRGDRSCDFPRHGGFYILDWSFAYIKSGRTDFLQQIHRMVDYWWPKRDGEGLLLIESRSPEDEDRFYNVNAPGQTLSLATSLLESAMLLDEKQPELAAKMRQRATVYINGFLVAPHDLEKGIFVLACKRDTHTLVDAMPIWGSKYGLWPASYVALTALCAYRMTGDEGLLRWSESVGHCYLREPFPPNVAVPAMDSGLGLSLLADLYDLTGEALWIDGGWRLAGKLIRIYLDGDLPRGAAGIDWYESQMGPSFLLHGLARMALLSIERNHCPLEADYTAR